MSSSTACRRCFCNATSHWTRTTTSSLPANHKGFYITLQEEANMEAGEHLIQKHDNLSVIGVLIRWYNFLIFVPEDRPSSLVVIVIDTNPIWWGQQAMKQNGEVSCLLSLYATTIWSMAGMAWVGVVSVHGVHCTKKTGKIAKKIICRENTGCL